MDFDLLISKSKVITHSRFTQYFHYASNVIKEAQSARNTHTRARARTDCWCLSVWRRCANEKLARIENLLDSKFLMRSKIERKNQTERAEK